jgi:hypothetical protein
MLVKCPALDILHPDQEVQYAVTAYIQISQDAQIQINIVDVAKVGKSAIFRGAISLQPNSECRVESDGP